MAKNNRMCKISSRKKGICFIIIILVIGITSLSLIGNFLVHSTNNSANRIYPSREVSHTIQWVNNSGFDTPDNWEFVSINQGAGIDTEGDIDTTQGQANLNILGNRGEFNDISGIPNNSEWIPTINTNFPILPNSYGIDEFGCVASHTWIDPHDPNQSVSIHWERNITLPLNLKDYNITSVSLNAIFNASVLTVGSDPSFPYRGGIDVINDSIGDRVDEDREFDYTRFYVLISDVQKEFSAEELAYFQTTDLGKDSNPEISNISNQHMLVRSEDDLRRYLSSALERDPLHRSFTLIIGMRIFCADNGQEDRDDWTSLRINTLNFSFSYEKIIDKSSSIVLKQSGKEITGENVQINSANLNFDCMINTTWPKLKSENSEIRININNKEHNERIDLSDINNIYSEILADGFDIAYLINPYEILNLSIQIFLGDTFGLNESIAISIDNVNVIIQYTEIFSDVTSEPWYTNLLFLGSLIGLGVLGTYFTAYYTLLKYPKPVRKVRKFRKSLNKQHIPNIKVKNKTDSIRSKYNRSSSISGKIGKGKSFKATNFLLVSLLFLSLVCMISLNLSSNHGIGRDIIGNNIYINNISPSREIPYSSQWMLNPKFDTMGSWTFIYGTEGDNSDISGNINNFQSNFNILGNLHTFNASSGIPTETDWKNITNPNFPDKPDNYQINSNGCSVSHYWSEKADQAPSIHWDKNITMPEDMSDYVITSIDLSVIVNASVETESGNNDNINFPTLIGLDCPGDLVNNSATYDYAKFYVLISDLAKDKTYEVAYNQTVDLGKNGTNGLMADTELKVISQDKLIEYLTSVLETDNQNFTITLGLNLW
ncbi:MAG: hypothetical protein GF311_19315 [Candidatus Lokiarchaeota archaeon]|nr:hypothetical protein [Candidatus Lokiarchaeota archaeon]